MKVQIERMGYSQDGIAHSPEGKTIFIPQTVVGDLVDIELIEDKAHFSRAKLKEVLEPSSFRVTLNCSPEEHSSVAPWAHIAYDAQLRFKQDAVRDAFIRIGKFDSELIDSCLKTIIASPKEWAYRNKFELNVQADTKGLKLGVHELGNNTFLPLSSCSLIPKQIEKLPKALSGALNFALKDPSQYPERVGIRYSERSKDLEIALWTSPGPFDRKVVSKVISDATKASSIVRVLLKGPAKSRKVSGVEVLKGKGFWKEKLLDYQMQISAPSFFQVNTKAADKLVQTVLDYLKPQVDDTIFDLYSGAGTFSVPLAQASDNVIAIESYGPAVRDLRRNAEINQVFIEDIGGDAARELPSIGQAHKIIVDPPRAGLAESVVKDLDSTGAKQIVYVSCNPSTLARDIRRLVDLGNYNVEAIQPLDLFPQSYHVETVALLSKLNTEHHLDIEIGEDELSEIDFSKDATYGEIKKYVLDKYGLKVSSLYIAQIKRKHGLIERENYNFSKKENQRVPNCPEEKEKAIEDALEHFGMI